MASDTIVVPPESQVVRPCATAHVSVLASRLLVVDYGQAGDWRFVNAQLRVAAQRSASALVILQKDMIDELKRANELSEFIGYWKEPKEGDLSAVWVLPLRATTEGILIRSIQSAGYDVYGSAPDGSCGVIVHAPGGRIIVGMPGPVLGATPLSNLMHSFLQSGSKGDFDALLESFANSTVGIVTPGSPHPAEAHVAAATVGNVRLASTTYGDGQPRIAAFADPSEYNLRFTHQCNAEALGRDILGAVLRYPDCYGILLDSALAEVSLVIPRPAIEKFLNCNSTTAATVQELLARAQRQAGQMPGQKSPIEAQERLVAELSAAVRTVNERANSSQATPSEKQAAEQLAQGDVSGAISLLAKAAAESGARASGLYRQQAALLRTRDLAQALQVLEHALQAQPDDFQTLWDAGDVALLVGKAEIAGGYYRSMLEGAQRAATLPDDLVRQRNLSAAYNKIGDAQSARGDSTTALSSYQSSLQIRQKLAAADPRNSQLQRDLSVSYDRIGDMRSAQGDSVAALSSYCSSLQICQMLALADPQGSQCQRDLAVSYSKVGDAQSAQGDSTAALSSYRSSLQISQQLAAADPRNSDWQRNLAVSYENIGDTQYAQGDSAAALSSYQASLQISQQLAAADPGNHEWQHGLSTSYSKIGDVQSAHGDSKVALSSYRSSLQISQQLAATDPSNHEWQRGLSIGYDRIGNAQSAQGDSAAALSSYRSSLEIRQKLTAVDPRNSDWQRDLFVSYVKIGETQSAQGDSAAALRSYQASLQISQKLAATDPSNREWQRDLSVSYDRIGDMLRAQDDRPAGLLSYQASLQIRQRLAAADPRNSVWQRDLSVIYDKIGDVQRLQGDSAAALRSFQLGLQIRYKLASADPLNAEWQIDLAVSCLLVGAVTSDRGQARVVLEKGLTTLEQLRSAGRLARRYDKLIESFKQSLSTRQLGTAM